MNKKTDKYKHIIYECKNDEEVIKSQDIVFKYGWSWSDGKIYHGSNLYAIKCIILQSDNKIKCSPDWSAEKVVNFYDNDGCLIVNSLVELELLLSPINYNEKRVLIYD